MDYAFIKRQKISHELCEIGRLYLIVGVSALLALLALPTVSFLA